jgi:hypothetical protein
MRWVALLLAALCGVASADSTRKVEVVTDPPGATIYLNDLDAGEACSPTPCSVQVPAGKKTAVIARKDGYAEEYGVIDLRKGNPKTLTLKLTATTATLVADDVGLTGGTILVDDVDKGKAPAHVPIETAGHHVVVIVKGRTIVDDYIKVDPGEEFTIKPDKAEPAPLPPKPVAVPKVEALAGTGANTDEVLGTGSATTVEKPDDNHPREIWIAGGGIFAVGFRQFKYDHPMNLPPTENEGGQVLVGPSLQIWPMRLLGLSHLRGLSIYGKVGFGVNQKPVLQDPNATPTGASTYWGNIEVDLQQRWDIGDSGAIELGGGFVRDQLEYQAMSTSTNLSDLPYADYKSLRLGVKGILRLGAVEPYLQIEGRIPLSEGMLATNFSKVDVTGAAGAVGLAATFGPVVAKLEAAAVYYSWSITSDPPGTGVPGAGGATDIIETFTFLLGLSY